MENLKIEFTDRPVSAWGGLRMMKEVINRKWDIRLFKLSIITLSGLKSGLFSVVNYRSFLGQYLDRCQSIYSCRLVAL